MAEQTARRTTDWQAWQDSWDRQQEGYLPDREQRFQAMLDLVEAVVGTSPAVLDLACGTGTITGRVLHRFPGATTVGVDLDPALLAIAQGTFAGQDRARFTTADLREPGWAEALPHRRFDAVLTSTALHWLKPEPLREVYRAVAGLLRPGGVFLNSDHMPDPDTPRLNEAEAAWRRARQEELAARGAAEDWEGWWRLAAADEVLAEPVARRFEIFGSHADGAVLPEPWHHEALRAAGFAEVRTVWRSVPDAVVLGLK